MREEFDADGILVGWYGTARNRDGQQVAVFVPRRDQDIESDRTAIRNLLARARKGDRE